MPRRNTRAKNENYRKSGELIYEARDALGFTQETLAAALTARLKKPITRQRVQNWEKGVAMPRPIEMAALAATIQLTADEITAGERAFQGVREPPPPAMSSAAVTIGKAWDQLPSPGQKHIAEQLWSMIAFMEKSGEMATHIFGKPSAETDRRLKEHEQLLERLQEISRRELVGP